MDRSSLTRLARQVATGLAYAVVSVLLVIGSLSLALAQQHAAPAPALTVTPSAGEPPQGTVLSPATSTATSTSATASTAVVPVIPLPTATSVMYFPTVEPLSQPPAAPPQACGPLYGWVREYWVQPGDTLFRIATRYHTTVPILQRANCKQGTVIFPGELLWVPYHVIFRPGLTTIPNFDTPTDWPTESPTGTASVPTATASVAPIDTATATP